MSGADAPRFVAFSTIDDEPWEAGTNAGDLLGRVRELAFLGLGLVRELAFLGLGLVHFTEILDCGAEAGDVLCEGMVLTEARTRYSIVFRGDGVPGLTPVPLEAAEP